VVDLRAYVCQCQAPPNVAGLCTWRPFWFPSMRISDISRFTTPSHCTCHLIWWQTPSNHSSIDNQGLEPPLLMARVCRELNCLVAMDINLMIGQRMDDSRKVGLITRGRPSQAHRPPPCSSSPNYRPPTPMYSVLQRPGITGFICNGGVSKPQKYRQSLMGKA
jgi:hypothetical protein